MKEDWLPTPAFPTQHILVVDDSREITALLAAWLEDLAVVSIAHSGEEAWLIAASTKPHVMLVDILMPRTSGFEVVETLRRRPGGLDAQVLFMTGLQEPANFRRARELGAKAVLHKPLEETHVRELVLAALLMAAA
jgi:CheY-like chemotaxis protein